MSDLTVIAVPNTMGTGLKHPLAFISSRPSPNRSVLRSNQPSFSGTVSEAPRKSRFKKAVGFLYSCVLVSAGFMGRGYWDALWVKPDNQVVSVHDGDTLTLANGEKVRLYGIDAPELTQPFGEKAQQYLEKLVKGKTVSVNQKGKSFDRKVCILTIDGVDINREMVRAGLAFEEPHYAHGEYHQDEIFAHKAQRGLWSSIKKVERPWDYRKRHRNTPHQSNHTFQNPLRNEQDVFISFQKTFVV